MSGIIYQINKEDINCPKCGKPAFHMKGWVDVFVKNFLILPTIRVRIDADAMYHSDCGYCHFKLPGLAGAIKIIKNLAKVEEFFGNLIRSIFPQAFGIDEKAVPKEIVGKE